jgi:cellulose synthase (UDP-forming)
MKKAGNLRHAYENSTSEFIAIFDADFAPREDFLTETLPYMQKNSQLGIVQTPQYFRQQREQTWMERGSGAVQEFFYRVVQVSRNRFSGAICVGSCGLYRRTALESIGGTSLIEHSEDVHTGFDMGQKGWGLQYIPVVLATGISAVGPDSFLTQQYRWCEGSMSLLGARKFWKAHLKFPTWCCYVSGFMYYIQTALATFALPLIPIVLLAFLPSSVELHNYLWILPSLIFTLVIFPFWHNGRYGPASFMTKSLYGWAHTFALIDIIRGRRQGWQATGATSSRRPTRRIWFSILVWGGLTTIAWVGLSVYRMTTLRPVNFIFLLVTGIIFGWSSTVMPFLARAQSNRG